jgi:hypothetical protein
MENKINQNIKGMNLDSISNQVGQGEVTWALNANIQSIDGSRFTYTNELGNQLCTTFKPGFRVVGQPYYIVEQDIIIFALHNPDTGESEIGKVTGFNKDCLKRISKEEDCGCQKGDILEDELLDDVKETEVKGTNCSKCYCYQIITPPGDNAQVIVYYTDCNGTYRGPGEDLTTFTPGSVFCVKDNLITYNSNRPGGRLVPIRENNLPCDSSTVLGCCTYETVLNASCLNFSLDYPVWFKHKPLPCDTFLYFVSKNNPPRRISLSLPKGVDACGKPQLFLNCNEIEIFPKTCHPEILPTIIQGSGQLKAGSYRFTLAYTDRDGNELTDYFDLTSEVPIFERDITVDTDYITSKSISMNITHHTDVFDYFNLAVQQTVNTVSTYYLVGKFRVNQQTQTYTYTGNNIEEYSSVKVLNRSPRYETAGIIEDSDDILFLAELEGDIEYNLQPLANRIKLYWETIEMPADLDQYNYHNGVIVSDFRGYMRDEVYAFGIKFKLKTGKYTKIFHIPGRTSTVDDRVLLTPGSDNLDVFSQVTNCDKAEPIPTWKVYNTGSKFATPKRCVSTNDPKEKEFGCEIKLGQQGEFSYWESTLKYPCNEDIWGDPNKDPLYGLADTPIRFHKFPDCVINHIHNNAIDDKNFRQNIYPIGVRPDLNILNDLINTFPIYNPKTKKKDLALKDLICGFELVRSSRFGNKSVIAKGLAYDVATANDKTNNRTYYYANYPYNDIDPEKKGDYFLSTSDEIYSTSDINSVKEAELRQKPFINSDFTRFTFHSPDTHFQFPQLGTEMKIESIEFGNWEGNFKPVTEHPKYKFLTQFDFAFSAVLGTILGTEVTNGSTTEATTISIGATQTADTTFNLSSILTNTSLINDILEKSIPYVNYAYSYHSKANYNIAKFSIKKQIRRPLQTAVYLSPNNQNVPNGTGGTEQVNNYQRESSVYLKINKKFANLYANEPDNSRNTLGSWGDGWCSAPDTIKSGRVKANYVSIKRTIPDQYGTIDRISYVNTGDFYELDYDQYGTGFIKCKFYPTFGGDIFINRFALKRKMPFFIQNMVGRPDGIDFDYQLVPNILYPTYYIGTSPDTILLSDIFTNGVKSSIALGLAGLIVALIAPEGNVQKIANIATRLGFGTAVAQVLIKTLASFVPKNNLDCDETLLVNSDPFNIPDASTIDPTDFTKLLEVFTDIFSALFNTKDLKGNPFYQKGKFYLSAYGIPVFFVESEVNVDMRHGRNFDEENFYPNVGTDVNAFGDWLQEYRVPIKFDNYYSYNATYSKQNFENYNQPYASFEPDEICSSVFPNRVIYSDASNQEENKDSWLIFRTNNYYDFPKTNGKLIALNQVENNKMLARFENTTQAYNARIIIDSSYPTQLELGTGNMFSTKPIDYVRADLGYVGSQHKAYISCKYGSFWTDAKRGFIYQLSGSSGFDEITKENFNWFKRNLPFQILDAFPDFPVDNSFKDVGIAMVWDERFERVFFTKRDYKVKDSVKDDLVYDPVTGVFTYLDTIVFLGDPNFFEDKSWTIAYSPITKGWISFYSFRPNYYVGLTSHFQSGNSSGLWHHILSPLRYQTYYNKLEPYVIEYNVDTLPQVSTVNSVTLFQDIQKFYNKTDYYSLGSANNTNKVNFTKAFLYNKEQCSGMLYLVPESPNDLSQRTRYPRIQPDHIEVLYSHREQKFTFNNFWDTVNWTSNNQPIFVTDWDLLQNTYYTDKVLNPKAIIYQARQGRQMPLKSTQCRVRLIQDQYFRYRFLNTLQLTQTNPSII